MTNKTQAMDLCNVNVEKLRLFKRRGELTIEYVSEEVVGDSYIRHFLVNDKHDATVAHDHYLSKTVSIEEDREWLYTLIKDALKNADPWTRKL
jgi:hypothetical protein